MGFHSNIAVGKLVGFITAVMALLSIAAALTVNHAGAKLGVLLLATILTTISAVAFTYRHSVIIDSRKMVVATTKRILFWIHTRHFGFGEFVTVGVTPSAGGESTNGSATYSVHLVGPIKLTVPGKSDDYERMHSRARRISEVLNLPLEAG